MIVLTGNSSRDEKRFGLNIYKKIILRVLDLKFVCYTIYLNSISASRSLKKSQFFLFSNFFRIDHLLRLSSRLGSVPLPEPLKRNEVSASVIGAVLLWLVLLPFRAFEPDLRFLPQDFLLTLENFFSSAIGSTLVVPLTAYINDFV
jgi:hypothetical protein